MMTPHLAGTPRAAQRHQHGFGLIEVLVAMTLGLVLLGGVGYLFIGSKQMSVAQTDGVRINESVRNSMDVMGRALRQAGYKLNLDQALANAAIGGVDGGGANETAGSDILIVRHDPAWTNTPAAGGFRAGAEANCQGATVTAVNGVHPVTNAPGVNTNLVLYQFRVVDNQLRCYATDNTDVDLKTGVVVADNVENMQVSYALGTNENITQYVDSPTQAEFLRVLAVRVTLLVRGPSTKGVVGGAQTLTFNGGQLIRSDGYLRSAVTTTFMVRNQARGT